MKIKTKTIKTIEYTLDEKDFLDIKLMEYHDVGFNIRVHKINNFTNTGEVELTRISYGNIETKNIDQPNPPQIRIFHSEKGQIQ